MDSGRGRAIIEGLLVGSALGRPANGLRRGHLQQALGGPLTGFLANPAIFPDRPERNMLPGLHGVNGQMVFAALALREADETERSPVARVGARLQEFAGADDAEPGVLRAPGGPLRDAIIRWRSDYPWEEHDFFARTQRSEGLSAAAMALVPVALGIDNAPEVAARLARLTHARLLPVSAAFAVAKVGALLVGGGKRIDACGIVQELIAALAQFETTFVEQHCREWEDLGWEEKPPRLSAALGPLASLLREENDALAEKTIISGAASLQPVQEVTRVQNGFIGTAIPWLLYHALAGKSPCNTMEIILNGGGETSALASLLAGLLLCRYEREFLPDEWFAGTLALPLMYRCLDGDSSAGDVAAAEAAWNAKEEALRQPLRRALDKEAENRTQNDKSKAKSRVEDDQDEAKFAPPPHLWLKPGEEEDPEKKRILKEARGKRRIDWKESRRRDERDRRH